MKYVFEVKRSPGDGILHQTDMNDERVVCQKIRNLPPLITSIIIMGKNKISGHKINVPILGKMPSARL